MKKLVLILSCILCLASCVLNVNAQTPCPNSFKCGDTLIDIRDNYKYPTVQIGTQCWFKVNLLATKYINGDSIPHITNTATWINRTTGAWCDYNNDVNNGIIYGHMYNWYTINDNRSLCPMGWYIQTNEEWNIIVNFLGGSNIAGGAMKQTGTTYWMIPNKGADNSSGFTALPGGYRDGSIGSSLFMGNYAYWWTFNTMVAWYCALYSGTADSYLYFGPDKADGMYIRCVKYN